MADSNRTNDITLLFDYYGVESQNLYNSFLAAGVECNVAVINDDGFLPDGVTSIYQSFLGSFNTNAKPKYFNEIPVPDYWEISGTNNSGQISNFGRLRGRIFYANPTYRRLVRAVEWLDNKGVVRFCDYYNRYGVLYARSTFDMSQKIILKSYFDNKGREIIVEDYVTDDIILNTNDKVMIFHSKVEFVRYYLTENGLDKTRIFINSLGVPFFVSDGRITKMSDVLFWQEYPRDDIPGNMQYIIEGKANHIDKIYVQKKSSYDKLVELGASTDTVKCLGYVYPYVRSSQYRPQALTLTNSDKIDNIDAIVSECADIHFHIAALTEMSSKLMALGKHDNVTLYPTVTQEAVDELYEKCDIYLDINRENEILNAVNRAFLNNQIIFAFNETIHNVNYISSDNRIPSEAYQDMIDRLKDICDDSYVWDDMLIKQRDDALSEEQKAYKTI